MLNLDLPGLRVLTEPHETEHEYEVTAEVVTPPSVCPHCGSATGFGGHGGKSQIFMDLPANGKHVRIGLKRRRYRCRACSRTFLEPLDDMDRLHMMTRRLVAWVAEQGADRAYAHVAQDVGISEPTVRRIVREVREQGP